MSDLEHDTGPSTPSVPYAVPPNTLGGIDTTDRRPIDQVQFGLEAPAAEREDVVRRVRGILAMCNVEIVDDINRLGCTGLAEKLSGTTYNHSVVEVGAFLRLGLAGCGTGLPCFVPPTRFCLIHNTIGGLQDGQQPLHAECIESVSRDLTAAERVHAGLIDKARHMRGRERDLDAQELLGGRRPEDLADVIDGVQGGPDVVSAAEDEVERHVQPPIEVRPRAATPAAAEPWKCEEHTITVWSCRHCLAQAIVEGPLEPVFAVEENFSSPGTDVSEETSVVADSHLQVCTSHEIDEKIKAAEQNMTTRLRLFACVATFTRKLARD